jgi:hypothetical protein
MPLSPPSKPATSKLPPLELESLLPEPPEPKQPVRDSVSAMQVKMSNVRFIVNSPLLKYVV